MKKVIFSLIIGLAPLAAQAQIMQRLQSAQPEQRKEIIKNMSPDERKALIKQFRENAMMEDLQIDDANKENFKKIYSEYQQSQREIKSGFNTNFDPEQLSDQEAEQKLDESFILGEKLIQNRKNYARKMQSVMKPQQVLKMFQNEGMMRDKVIDRRMDYRLKEDSARYQGGQGNGFRRGAPRQETP